MNYSAIKILPGNDNGLPKTCSKFVKTDAFTILPPFSPQIPGPPPTPNPYRILPPIVSRKRPSFVILQEVGSRPASREPSPSGRVSPFRGCGFKPPSREQSPSRRPPQEENPCDPSHHPHRSRSRLPVASHQKKARRMSKSVSPIGHANVSKPLNRHISYSPNRLTKILSEVNSVRPRNTTSTQQNKIETFKSPNRNIACQRSLSQRNLKELGTSSRAPTQNLRTQKPPIPHKPIKTTICTERTNLGRVTPTRLETQVGCASKCKQVEMTKSCVKKPTRLIPMSPVRAAKYEKTMKSYENLPLAVEKRTPMPPTRSKTTSHLNLPSKISPTKLKENISPYSKSTSPVKTKTANKTPKSTTRIMRTPSRTAVKTTKKPPCAAKKQDDIKEPALDEITSSPAIAQGNDKTTTALVVTQPSEERIETQSNEKLNAIHMIGKRALTTSNLLDAIKKKNMTQNKTEEKRELLHSDTSRSLPISIGGTGMTDSAVTLIQTTTEPALAPVQPELIHEIRTAINEVRNSTTEEVQLSNKNDVQNSSLSSSTLPNEVDMSRDTASTEEEVEKKRASPAAVQKRPPLSQYSPHLKHVTANLEIKKPGPRSDDKKPLVKGKEEKTVIDKTPNVNNQAITATVKNKSEMLNMKNQSTESLVPQPTNTMAWDRFRSSRRSKGALPTGSHLVRVSTITQASTTAQATECSKGSRYRKYFCYFCDKYKSRKRDNVRNIVGLSSQNKRSSWTRHKNGFRGMLNKLRCRDKERGGTALRDAKADSNQGPAQKSGCCASCGSGLHKCLGILCCWKTQSTGDKLCSGCCKCWCCGAKKQTVITESERRRSTISTTRKPRKWTRVFTDFPKLDSSFVEHASVMRGAIPVLPVPLAWICLILNVFLPGSGTFSSGVFCLCTGKARFSINDSLASRFGSFLVNLLVAGSQLFTVLFCLVGWGWSVWWGVIMLRMARKNKRILLAERVAHEPRPIPVAAQNRDVERGTTT